MDVQASLHNVGRGMGFCEMGEETRRKCRVKRGMVTPFKRTLAGGGDSSGVLALRRRCQYRYPGG